MIITLPPPPSLNKLWSAAPGKRRVRSPEYNEWLHTAGWELKRQIIGMPPIAGRYNMEIQVPISRRDTGNWEKPIGDLLEACGVVTNDGNVHRLTVLPVARADCAVELIELPEMDGIRRAPSKIRRAFAKPRARRATAGDVAKWRRAGVLV